MSLTSGLQPWLKLHRHNEAYDVVCQHAINVEKRRKELDAMQPEFHRIYDAYPPELLRVKAIGKFHIGGHTSNCRTKYSFRYIPGVGMTDGEAQERVWSGTNQLADSTREMADGHRHDSSNYFSDDRNVQRANGMRTHCYRAGVNSLT